MYFVTERGALQLEAALAYSMYLYDKVQKNEARLWEYWLHGYAQPWAMSPKKGRGEWMSFDAYKQRCEEKARANEVPWEMVEDQTSNIKEQLNRKKVKE